MAGPYHHVLVPLDGSSLAAEALPHAVAIAAKAGARLTLFQVLPSYSDFPPDAFALQPDMLPAEGQEAFLAAGTMQDHWLNHARLTLAELARDLAGQAVDTQAQVAVGAPGRSIVTFAQSNRVDLIVMSTHGRSGLAQWVYGSVAREVLHEASCPVLLVRSATQDEAS